MTFFAKNISNAVLLFGGERKKKRKQQLIALAVNCCLLTFSLHAQNVGINSTGATPNPKALLDIDATSMSPKMGLLIPRMTTTERNTITAPIPESLLIYNTTTQCYEGYNAATSMWVAFGCLGCNLPNVVTAGTQMPAGTQIIWNWNIASGAVGYKWNTINDYASATDVGAITTYTQTGLTSSTAYTLYVWAYNVCGNTVVTTLTTSTLSMQIAYTTPGAYTWLCPTGVTSVSVVCVGGGAAGDGWQGGGGGGLGWRNNITVVPGNFYTVVVGAGGSRASGDPSVFRPGGDSYFINVATVKGGGAPNRIGGNFVGTGGGSGGSGSSSTGYGGGGGAGGYSGNGGNGGNPGIAGTGGAGAGGNDGGGSGAGGGTAIYGQGVNGQSNPATGAYAGGGTGSYLTGNTYSFTTVNPAGVGGGSYAANPVNWSLGGDGAVRIIWPGTTRQFPSTNTADL